MTRIHNTAWKGARKRAGLEYVRVHDLKHTFGRRLRSVGVSFEDRQDLLGHVPDESQRTIHQRNCKIYMRLQVRSVKTEKWGGAHLLRNPNLRKEKRTTQINKVISL